MNNHIMSDNWPPEGYSTPESYEISNPWILGIGFALILPVLAVTRSALSSGASEFATWSLKLARSTGVADNLLVYLFAVGLAVLCWIFVSGALIIFIHESVHYAISAVLGLNPRFEWNTQLYIKNPSVVAYDEGITRWQNIATLSGPFVILSLLCAAVMWSTSGVFAATFAIMFAINAVPSCGDIYNVGRILRMPQGTLFANFDEDDGLETEFVTPE